MRLDASWIEQSCLVILACMSLACRSATVPPQESVFGQWRVSGSRCPVTCAVSAEDAARWLGTVATYSGTRAQFAGNTCEKPNYVVDYWPASGIYGGVRLVDLGISAGSVMVVDVQCSVSPVSGSDPWSQAPGAFLIVRGPTRLFMVWKGRYFDFQKE